MDLVVRWNRSTRTQKTPRVPVSSYPLRSFHEWKIKPVSSHYFKYVWEERAEKKECLTPVLEWCKQQRFTWTNIYRRAHVLKTVDDLWSTSLSKLTIFFFFVHFLHTGRVLHRGGVLTSLQAASSVSLQGELQDKKLVWSWKRQNAKQGWR